MNPMSPMRNVSVALFASAKEIEEKARFDYRSATAEPAYWAMIDLRSSAAFRLSAGDEPAFVRARAFAQTISRVVSWYPSLIAFKELGDGVLLRATDFRSMFEAICLIDALEEYWEVDSARDSAYPSLRSRKAITFGEGASIDGDFFGSPIDLVARLSSYKTDDLAILAAVDDEVRNRNESRLLTEYPFVRFTDPQPMPSHLLKENELPRRMSEIHIDRADFGSFRDYFTPAREEHSRARPQ